VTPYLETPRLLLREFTTDDADLVGQLDSDPDVMHFVTGGEPTLRGEVVAEVLPAWLGYYAQGSGHGFWAAIERATGDFLGWFHLRPGAGHPPGEPELGYRLRRTAWGQGYAVEGSQALIDKAFTELGAARVLAETMVVHTASRRVMEKCGMRVSRTFHQDWAHPIPGDEHGDVEYAITLDEWRAAADGGGAEPAGRRREPRTPVQASSRPSRSASAITSRSGRPRASAAAKASSCSTFTRPAASFTAIA